MNLTILDFIYMRLGLDLDLLSSYKIHIQTEPMYYGNRIRSIPNTSSSQHSHSTGEKTFMLTFTLLTDLIFIVINIYIPPAPGEAPLATNEWTLNSRSYKLYCQDRSQNQNPKGPAPTQSNPVKISSKGTGADTKILWATTTTTTTPPPTFKHEGGL